MVNYATFPGWICGLGWGDRWNSNPRRPEPQSGALPTELRPHGGEGGIRTLARLLTPPNPLAGGPLWPLGYLAK